MSNLIAQRITNPALGAFGNQTGEQFLAKLIPALVELIFVVGFLAFVITFLIGGIKYITAGGDKGKVQEAQQSLGNALLGLFILFMFFGILSFVECFFGIGLREIKIAQYSIGFSSIPVCTGSASGAGGASGSVPGVPGGPIPGTGVSACGCSNGGCATLGQVGLSNAATPTCYTCTAGGWANPQPGTCPAITCVATCN
jgi:hypothetical protein